MLTQGMISKTTRLIATTVAVAMTLLVYGCGDVFVHEEFDKLTMNHSESEVSQAIGKPASVDSSNPQHVVWVYYGKTVDIGNANRRDTKTLVIFSPDAASHNLKVVEVKYEHG